MADRITQIQDALSELVTQMQASVEYVRAHHKLEPLGPGDTVRQENKGEEANGQAPLNDPLQVEPYPDDEFKAGQLELARDLILKEQQIEFLISVLPGLYNSEKDQEEMIMKLEEELKAAEEERKQAIKEKEEVLSRLENVIRSVKRP